MKSRLAILFIVSFVLLFAAGSFLVPSGEMSGACVEDDSSVNALVLILINVIIVVYVGYYVTRKSDKKDE